MKFMTRLTIGAAMAGAMFGLAGTASAAAPAATNDARILYHVNGPYPTENQCKAARAVAEIWNNTQPCYTYGNPRAWYFIWW